MDQMALLAPNQYCDSTEAKTTPPNHLHPFIITASLLGEEALAYLCHLFF